MGESLKVAWEKYHKGFKNFDLKGAVESMVGLARAANKYVDDQKPWELAKADRVRLAVVLANLLTLCKAIGEMLQPIIPETAEKILKMVGGEKVVEGEVLFPPKN